MVNDHIGHDEKLDAADTRSYLSPSSFTFSNKLLKGDESIMVLKIKPVQVFVMKESKKKFYGWMLTTIIFTYIRHKSPCQRCRPDAQSRHCSASGSSPSSSSGRERRGVSALPLLLFKTIYITVAIYIRITLTPSYDPLWSSCKLPLSIFPRLLRPLAGVSGGWVLIML